MTEEVEVELDDWQLSIYMAEIVHQAKFAQMATEDLVNALNADPRPFGTDREFASLQSLLSAAAMISKLLWLSSAGGKQNADVTKFSKRRSAQLRQVLEIGDLPVLRNRKVRDGFEHLDERLDRHLVRGERNLVDRNIGPREGSISINGVTPPHIRFIDPYAATASVLDDEVNLNELNAAINEVSAKAEAWLASISPFPGGSMGV